MALPITIPSSPADANSPSTDGSNGPCTPVSPVQTLALPPPVDGTSSNSTNAAPNSQTKRKPSRRANTAERRATHNAVERQRRETLNGRFLVCQIFFLLHCLFFVSPIRDRMLILFRQDLAALLPNLSQIRRPSKSSIVNSSIAHIHASRRHRLIAARELRLLKLESDALRRELNEWRDRSGLPRVEEPVRGDAFQMIMSGEVEVLNIGPIEEEDGAEYGYDEYGDDEFVPGHNNAAGPHVNVATGEDAIDDMRSAPAAPDANAFAHAVSHGSHIHGIPSSLRLQTVIPRANNVQMQTAIAHSPMVVQNPSGVSFENPAMPSTMYDTMSAIGHNPSYYAAQVGVADIDSKTNMWSNQILSAQGQQMLFTPNTPSHGQQQQQQQAAFLMNLQRQQQALQRSMIYSANADSDDSSSVGSAASGSMPRRERSGSMGSSGSGGYGSPGSNVGNFANSYDIQSGMVPSNTGASIPRRMAGGAWDEGIAMGSGLGMTKNQAVSVGGGPTHGFAAAMMM